MRKSMISNIRKAVATMANALRKAGLSLSEAFRKAWRRVKVGMTFRAVGVTYDNRQERLAWFSGRSISATLEREPENIMDANAIKIILHADGKRGMIGYVNRALAETLAPVIDKGVQVACKVRIIGGYIGCETLGVLMELTV